MATPYSYTRNHCIAFAQAFTEDRFNAAARQVIYLTRPQTLDNVEFWADRLVGSPTNREFRGLVNECYNVVF